MNQLSDITFNGLWKNNPALVQVLGLCPLLGVSNSIVNALGLGFATMIVLMSSNFCISIVRKQVPDIIRLPIFVMIIASLTSCVELLMQAYTYELYTVLGIFIPLIVTNCIILGRADAFACKNPVFKSTLDGLMMGLGFALVLLCLGFLRELLGTGKIFSNMSLLFGEIAKTWQLIIIKDYQQFLIVILPPGAFILMGLLLAIKNLIDQKISQKQSNNKKNSIASRRVRLTDIS